LQKDTDVCICTDGKFPRKIYLSAILFCNVALGISIYFLTLHYSATNSNRKYHAGSDNGSEPCCWWKTYLPLLITGDHTSFYEYIFFGLCFVFFICVVLLWARWRQRIYFSPVWDKIVNICFYHLYAYYFIFLNVGEHSDPEAGLYLGSSTILSWSNLHLNKPLYFYKWTVSKYDSMTMHFIHFQCIG
jgi:hypothetical protein